MVKEKDNIFFNIISVAFMLIFIPTLFCIFAWGNEMDYNLATKLICSFGNKKVLVFSLGILLCIMVFLYLTRKIQLTKLNSILLNIGLCIMFVILFVANIKICECINISQGWDVSCVRGGAYQLHKGVPIADDMYFSIYPNNVPITFILYKLFHFADGLDNFNYVQDFMWVITICLLVSLAGFVTCITVKKLTKNFSLTVVAALIYFIIMLLTPWKTVAYTDMFAFLFPVLSLCLYFLCSLGENRWLKYLLWFLSFAFGFLGSLIKPTVAVVLIAIVICELIKIIPAIKERWKELFIKLCLVAAAVLIYLGSQNHIYKVTGYTPNKEISMTSLHYMMMGLNEDSTGSYSSEDYGFSCSRTPEEKIPAQIERIRERLEEKGFFGYLGFAIKKMVMTFNDGTFGWGREGFYDYGYPVYSTNQSFVYTMQRYFLPQGEKSADFNTHSQIIWFVVIFCMPALCLVPKKEKEKYLPLLLTIFGVILYLILFEARARYLICFIPVFVAASVIGIKQYYILLTKIIICVIAIFDGKKKEPES